MRPTAVAAVLFLVPALGAAQGGFQPGAWVWAGALAAWGAALSIVLSPDAGALREAWPWPAIGGGLLLWTLASTLWSAEPQQSLLEARRMVVYAAVALALVVLSRRHAAWTLVGATHLALTGLVTYSLGRYLLGSRGAVNLFEGYFLSRPLGYANAVGILAALGLLLALAPALEAGRTATRAFGGGSVPVLACALTLTGSNASWLALGVGLLVAAALAPRPGLMSRPAIFLAVPTVVIVLIARYSRYADVGSTRMGGRTLAAAVVGASAVGALATTLGRRRRDLSGRPTHRSSLIAAVVLVVAGGAAAAVAAGGSSQPRASYYRVAWHEYLAHPLLGTGAGTFGRYWLVSGDVERWGGALDAHSLYLEAVAELGPVGLLLLVGFLLYPLRRVVGVRDIAGVPAAAGAAVAFLIHAGLDWDWEMPAVVVAGLACLAAVLLAGRRQSEEPLPHPARAAALSCAIALGLASVAGTASSTQPSATLDGEAPLGGASSSLVG